MFAHRLPVDDYAVVRTLRGYICQLRRCAHPQNAARRGVEKIHADTAVAAAVRDVSGVRHQGTGMCARIVDHQRNQ